MIYNIFLLYKFTKALIYFGFLIARVRLIFLLNKNMHFELTKNKITLSELQKNTGGFEDCYQNLIASLSLLRGF